MVVGREYEECVGVDRVIFLCASWVCDFGLGLGLVIHF